MNGTGGVEPNLSGGVPPVGLRSQSTPIEPLEVRVGSAARAALAHYEYQVQVAQAPMTMRIDSQEGRRFELLRAPGEAAREERAQVVAKAALLLAKHVVNRLFREERERLPIPSDWEDPNEVSRFLSQVKIQDLGRSRYNLVFDPSDGQAPISRDLSADDQITGDKWTEVSEALSNLTNVPPSLVGSNNTHWIAEQIFWPRSELEEVVPAGVQESPILAGAQPEARAAEELVRLQTENAALRNELVAAETQYHSALDHLENQRQDVQSRLNEQQQVAAELRDQLDEAHAQASRLPALEAELEALRSSFHSQTEQLAASEAQQNVLSDRLSALTDQLGRAVENQQIAEQQRATAREQVQRTQRELATARRQGASDVEALNQRLAAAEAQNEQATTQLAHSSAAVSTLREQLQTFQDAAAATEQDLQWEIATTAAAVQGLRDQAAARQQELEAAQAEQAALKREIESLRAATTAGATETAARQEELQQQLERAQNNVTTLTSDRDSLNQQVAVLQAQQARESAHLSNLQSANALLTRQLEATTALRQQDLDNAASALQIRLEEISDQITAQKLQIEQLPTAANLDGQASLEAAAVRVAASQTACEQALRAYESSLDALADLSLQQTDLPRVIQHCEESHKNLADQRSQLQAALDELATATAEARRRLDGWQSTLSDRRTTLEIPSNQLRLVGADLGMLNDRVASSGRESDDSVRPPIAELRQQAERRGDELQSLQGLLAGNQEDLKRAIQQAETPAGLSSARSILENANALLSSPQLLTRVLQRTLEGAQVQADRLSDLVVAHNARREESLANARELTRQYQGSQKRISELEEELETALAEKDEFEAGASVQSAELERLKVGRDALRADLKQSKQSLQTQTALTVASAQRVATLIKGETVAAGEIQRLRSRLQSEEQQQQALRVQLADIRQEQDQTRQALEQAHTARDEALQRENVLQQELEQVRAAGDRSSEALVELETLLVATKAEATAASARLQSTLEIQLQHHVEHAKSILDDVKGVANKLADFTAASSAREQLATATSRVRQTWEEYQAAAKDLPKDLRKDLPGDRDAVQAAVETFLEKERGLNQALDNLATARTTATAESYKIRNTLSEKRQALGALRARAEAIREFQRSLNKPAVPHQASGETLNLQQLSAELDRLLSQVDTAFLGCSQQIDAVERNPARLEPAESPEDKALLESIRRTLESNPLLESFLRSMEAGQEQAEGLAHRVASSLEARRSTTQELEEATKKIADLEKAILNFVDAQRRIEKDQEEKISKEEKLSKAAQDLKVAQSRVSELERQLRSETASTAANTAQIAELMDRASNLTLDLTNVMR